MNTRNNRSTRIAAVTASLILALLARVPFADGLLLHDHNDQGIHSHTLTIDDLHDGDMHMSWHHDHGDDHDDERNNDSNDDDFTFSLIVFMDIPSTALGIHSSFRAVIASIQPPASNILPRSMQTNDPWATARFTITSWSSAPPLRPAYTLDALLQSSQALLL